MGTFIHFMLDFTSIELKLIAGKHAQGLAIANVVDRISSARDDVGARETR